MLLVVHIQTLLIWKCVGLSPSAVLVQRQVQLLKDYTHEDFAPLVGKVRYVAPGGVFVVLIGRNINID